MNRKLLFLLALAGCYPDSDKIRALSGTGGTLPDAAVGGMGGTAAPDAAAPVDLGPLLPPGATADNCTDFGTAWCEKARQCQTIDVEGLGGPMVCPSRMKIWCEAQLADPSDTNWGPASFKTCIGSWSAMTCDEWRDFDLEILKGPSCFVPGKRGDGAGCWSFAQCGSGECGGENVCGICRPRVPAEGACTTDSQCQRGLVCGLKRCVIPSKQGDACDEGHPCRRSLLCKNGVCGAKAVESAACGSHTDCAEGLLCNFGKMTCGRAVVSSDRCSSFEPDGTVLFCAGGTTCENETCVANAGDNQACVAGAAPDCLWPAICAGGTCRIARPVNCPAMPAGGADAGM